MSDFSPPYDIANLLGRIDEEEVKFMVLSKQWGDSVLKYNFPKRDFNGKMRKLTSTWLQQNTWMRYSASTDALYCGPCLVFGRKESKEKTFISTPVTDWSNIGSYVKRHTKVPESHHHTCVLMAQNYLDVRSGKIDSIASSVSETHKTHVFQNRHILRKIIEVLVLCGQQNIAVRGHTEERSNFMAILLSKAKDDPILAQHLSTPADDRMKYTSPDIQNELICFCAEQIQQKVVTACNDSFCYALIADESTDKSTKEQVAICLRFVERVAGTGQCKVREEFLTYVQAAKTTGEELAELLLTALADRGIGINRMRAQGYDGAANMSGKHRGVQARIRQNVPNATYVHCKAHCLNLAIMHASKDPCVRTMMASVQEVAFAFDYSAKRLQAFADELADDDNVQEKLSRRSKLRTLCETRWTSRADSLSTFKSAYPVVVHALEHLREDGDEKAGQHLASIMKFDFIIALVVAEHTLQNTVPLSYLLQAVDCDLLEAVRESQTVISQLQNERADHLVWEALYESAQEIAEEFDIQPWMPRLAQRQRTRANPPAADPSEYWQRTLYYPFIDHLCQELTDRLLGAEERFRAQYLIPARLNLCTDDVVDLIFAEYNVDIPEDNQAFHNEVRRWRTRWEMLPQDDRPVSLAATLGSTDPILYPGISAVLTVLLTMPPSTATAERSFSVMRRVKTYLRATMGTERMAGLAILHIYRETEVDVERVIDRFAAQKNRKMDFV